MQIVYPIESAAMAELVDALDSGSSRGNSVDVRVILAAMIPSTHQYALVANGAIHDYALLSREIKKYSSVVAVDGGLVHCDKMNITPSLIIGDFDSTPPEILQKYSHIPSKKFSEHKDESDLELAIQAIDTPKLQKITLFGALEKRTDHTLANLYLISRYPNKLWLESENEWIWALKKEAEIPCYPGQTISFIPIGEPARGVTSSGLKWELNDATLDKSFFSLSNICEKNSVKITFRQGDLICCLQK